MIFDKIPCCFFSTYYDFTEDSQFTPYIGAGLGYTKITTEDGTIAGVNVSGGSVNALGDQLKIGGSFEVRESQEVFVEGTYAGTEDITANTVTYSNIAAWGARAGLRFRF